MPRSTIATLILAWETLLATIRASASGLPGVEVFIGLLEKLVGDAKDLTARVETSRGIKQQEAQQRRLLMQQGKDLTSRIRAALKAHYGIHNERLVEFGIRPIRSRKRPPAATGELEQPEKPEAPEQPKPEPASPSPAPVST